MKHEKTLKAGIKVNIIVAAIFFSMVFAVSAVDATVVKVNPASQTVLNPGDSFSVNVRVEDVTYMGADGATLNFDSGAMSVTGVTEGDFLKSAGYTIGFPIIDNTAGTVSFAYALRPKGVGVTGFGVLATINFATNPAAAVGEYNLDLTNVELLNGDGNEIPVDAIINGKVTIGNQPPSKPSKPSGQTLGQIGFSYSYSTATTDPDGDNVYYWFDWGDGLNSGWIGPYSSGASGSASKAWSIPDIYNVKAKAKDVRGAYSSPLWSDSVSVCINGLWVDEPSNPCKERRLTCSETYEYRDKSDGTICGCENWGDDPANECKERREIWKCSEGICTPSGEYEYQNKPDGTDCGSDGWVDTAEKKWVDEPGNECKEKEQKKREYRDYACSGGSCTYSVTNTQWIDTGETRNKQDGTDCGSDYYEDGASYCKGEEVWKHRRFHDFYCDGGTCTEHTSWVDDLVENCNDYDGGYCNGDVREYRDYYCSGGSCTYTVTSSENCNDYDDWVDTGDMRWIDEPGNECREKEQKKQEYRDYACSGGNCGYTVTKTSWGDTGNTRNKSDGTYCGCTANSTLKKCCDGTCSDTGICNSTYCGADSACDGKKPGDTCDANKNCNSSCKCITSPDVTTVSIGSGSAEANDTATIAIMINVSIVDAPSGLGNATINLTYNHSVVNVITVKNSSFDSFVYNTNNSSGLTRIVAYQTGATGLIGNIKFADIEFKSVGEEGDVSPLNLEVIELIDINSGPIPHVVKNGSFMILDGELNSFDTRSPENPYPSIFGVHNGTIKPNQTITVSTLYTYPCSGTGGHSEYMKIWNNSDWNVTARWEGYRGDWHNISFDSSFALEEGETYNYTIRTGSYPQIHHTSKLEAANGMGTITCYNFIDANGGIYHDRIPAIKLWSE